MDLSQRIPGYLVEKQNIVRLVLFTATFALVFINIYSPFGVSLWFNISKLQLFFYSSMIILTGVLVVVVSRIIMYQFTVRWHHTISLGQYLTWIGAEIVSMATFYALYEMIFLDDPRRFVDAFKISIQNTALVLLLPYSTLWLYFSWADKNRQLEKLSGETNLDSKEMIPFQDEKGVMRITLKISDLLFLQAADNYVTIFYNHQQKQARYLLRASLKQLETELKGTSFVRCHRSYMVNFEKVKIIRREKEGLILELETVPPVEIPVSKTYLDEVFKAFGGHTI